MRLADEIVESLGPIFSGENLVTHAFNLTKKPARESLRSGPAKAFGVDR
jgi:hypothetical protein